MNKMMKRAFLGAVLATVSMQATLAEAAPATATARARILRQITVTNTSDLDFGTIVVGASASTVQVSAAGVRSCGSGLTCSGTTTAANFDISGSANAVVTISGDNNVTLSNGTGGTMAASLVRSASSLTLANSGPVGGSFQVSGTLNVNAGQADGNYTGTFNVNVDYQ